MSANTDPRVVARNLREFHGYDQPHNLGLCLLCVLAPWAIFAAIYFASTHCGKPPVKIEARP